MRKLTFAAVLFLVPTLLSAQIISRTRTFSQLGTCTKDGEIKIITDAATAGTCAGGGTSLAACWCDLGTTTWISQPVPAATLDAYVPVTKAGQQSITATGAGNDITLVAADDVIIAPSDNINLNAEGGDVELAMSANYIGFQTTNFSADMQPSGMSIFSSHSSSLFEVTLSGADGYWYFNASGTNGYGTLAAATTIALDAAGSTDELGIAANSVSVGSGVAFRLVGGTAPPVACAAGTAGTVYYDTDINKLCVCNATNYVLVDDSSTTTGCS